MVKRRNFSRLFCALLVSLTLGILLVACGQAQAPKAQSGPYDENADPVHDISAALALAKGDNKPVLIDFGANWCLDCVVLSHYYVTEPVKSLLIGSYHLVLINVGNFDTHLDIVNQYGNPIEKGIPALVILDPAGKVLVTTKAGEFENARSMTAQQVYDYLRKWAPNG